MLSSLLEDLSSFPSFLLVIATVKITTKMAMIAATRTTTTATTIGVVLPRAADAIVGSVVLAIGDVLSGGPMTTELLSGFKEKE